MPKRLAKELSVHEVQTAPEMGWGDLDDGPLLDAMAGRFDVLATVDKNLPKQQQLNNRPCNFSISPGKLENSKM